MAQTDAFQGFCNRGAQSVSVSGLTSTNKFQNVIPHCSVTVYLTGTTTKATIYADAINTHLDNPFTADALTSLTPGKWLFYAQDSVGYDVIGSGGDAPNIYPTPVVLGVDLKVGGGGGGGGSCITVGPAGTFQVSNGAGGCTSTTIQVNGTPLLSPSPPDFVTTPTVVPFNTTAGQIGFNTVQQLGVILQHNDVNLLGRFREIPSILDFNDTTPPCTGTGCQNVQFLTDPLTGRLSGQITIPSATNPLLTMLQQPVPGQMIWIYPDPAVGSGVCGGAGWSNAIPGPSSGGLFFGTSCTNSISGFSLTGTGVSPASVTAVYGVAVSGFFPGSYNPPYAGNVNYGGATVWQCNSSSFTFPNFALAQSNINLGIAGSAIPSVTCQNRVVSNSSIGSTATAAYLSVPALALAVYYSGPPVNQPTALNIGPYLSYDKLSNTLSTQVWFPQWLNGIDYADLPVVAPPGFVPPSGTTAVVRDSTTSGACGPGGGTNIVHCIVQNGVWVIDSGGSIGDTITSPGATLSVGGTSTNTTLDFNLAHLNSWTAGLNLSGASSPLQLGGSAGTAAQCLLSAGTGATPTWGSCGAGGGIGGSGTTGFIPKFTASTTVGNSLLDFGVTNASQFTFGAAANFDDGTGNAGTVRLKQGTATANGTTAVALTAPTSVTSYRIQLPGSQPPDSSHEVLTCTNADPAVCSWGTGGGGGGGGYTNVTGSVAQTTVSALNTLCGSGTLYVTTPLSIATGGTITCPTQFSKAGILTIAAAQTVTFSNPITQTDGPSQIFTGSGVAVLSNSTAYTAWWGDVADYTGGATGTDDTSAIQACITAINNGRCVLAAGSPGLHKISSAITIAKSNVTLEGPAIGGGIPQINNLASYNRAALAQVTSATNGVDISSCTACGIRNVDVYSWNIGSGTASGVSTASTVGAILQNINSSDFINTFKFGTMSGGGVGQIDNLTGGYGYFGSGTTYGTVNLCGFNFASSGGYSSAYFSHLLGYLNNGVHGTSTAASFCLSGSNVRDLNVAHWESASAMDYGWLVTTAATGFNAYDINIAHGIADTQTISCIKTASYAGQQLNFSDTVCNGAPAASKAIDIESSSNVTLTNTRFMHGGTVTALDFYLNSSNQIAINGATAGNSSPDLATFATLIGSSNNTLTNLNLYTQTSSPIISLTSTSTANVISNSTFKNAAGTPAAISMDSTSGTNSLIDNSYGSGLASPQVSDAGTGNRWCDNSTCKNITSSGITALTGDVTATGPGSAAATIAASAVTTSKINNAAVTYAKMQNISANSVLLGGGASGSGVAPTEITLGTNLSMSGTTLNATAGGGYPSSEVHTASSSAELDFTSCISGTYKDYQIRVTDLIPATNNTDIQLQVSTNGGSSYDSTSGHYAWAQEQWIFNAQAPEGSASATSILISNGAGNLSNAANAGLSATLVFHGPGLGTGHPKIDGTGSLTSNASAAHGEAVSGQYLLTTAINAFRILSTSGNLTSGTVTCQPLPN